MLADLKNLFFQYSATIKQSKLFIIHEIQNIPRFDKNIFSS